MTRATTCDVLDVIPNTKFTEDQIQPFLKPANLMVTKIKTQCGVTLDDATLTQVEIWLTAHLVAVADPSLNVVREKVEGTDIQTAKGNIQNLTGIMSTTYGQTANMLSCKCLEELDKRQPTLDFV